MLKQNLTMSLSKNGVAFDKEIIRYLCKILCKVLCKKYWPFDTKLTRNLLMSVGHFCYKIQRKCIQNLTYISISKIYFAHPGHWPCDHLRPRPSHHRAPAIISLAFESIPQNQKCFLHYEAVLVASR